MDGENDDDIYALQLKEVFNSCDLENKGYIDRNELIDLSHKLQLGDQIPELLKEVFGDENSDGEVTFEQFKEGFVNILANAIDCLEDVTDDQSEWSEIGERRSLSATPDFLKDDKVLGNSPVHSTRKTSTPNVASIKHPLSNKNSLNGIRSAQSSDSGNGEGDSEEAMQLRQIWDNLAVGESGFINLLQLSIVCDHIGMEGMADNELELLFTELDKNGDGLISFNEFFEGLFLNKRPLSARSDKSTPPVVVDEPILVQSSVEGVETLNDESKELITPTNEPNNHPPLRKKRSSPRDVVSKDSEPAELFSALDPFKTGKINEKDIASYLKNNSLEQLEDVIQQVQRDDEGRIKLRDISLQLERIVYEKENAITRSVLFTYKKEISRLREEIEKSSNELTTMKDKSNVLDEENRTLTKESEDQMKKTIEENKKLLKDQKQLFSDKLLKRERELTEERNVIVKEHQNENQELRQRLEEIKSEDSKTKAKLKEASTEMTKLEENLSSTLIELNEERKKYARFQKVMESEKGLKQKVDELESQLKSLADLRSNQKERIKQLEDANKILQYQTEEQESEIEDLHLKLRITEENNELGANSIKRNGSYLSDYMKPDIVRRDNFGESVEESSDKEMEELQNKLYEQEKTIETLRRDLETVNRMLEEKDSTTSERHNREINRLTEKYASEIAELQLTMSAERGEIKEHFSKEKSELVEKYENKIVEIKRNFENDRQKISSSYQHEKTRWDLGKNGEKSLKRWESLFQLEKEEIELKYRSQINKLEEKIVMLETEKAEMELRFLNEKAELEQQFRIERSELMQNNSSVSRNYDSSQKYIDSLKEDLAKKQARALQEAQERHKNDKERFKERMQNELNEMKNKHSKEVNDERKNFQNQVSEIEKHFLNEQGSLKEKFSREKTELQQQFTRELKELKKSLRQNYDEELAVQLAEIRKVSLEERSNIEEELRDEKYELSKNLQSKINVYEKQLKNIKNELELTFAEKKNRMKEEFELEISLLEKKHSREISELQQAFSNGEAGIKTKVKEEFQMLLKEQKRDLEESYKVEKEQLHYSFNREKAGLQSSWQLEKLTMNENFKQEKQEMERNLDQEKMELIEKSKRQKQKLEEHYRKQKETIEENRNKKLEESIRKETQHLKTSVQHLEEEVTLLQEQKKELENKVQVFELKSLSLKQDEAEIREFMKEKKNLMSQTTKLKQNMEANQKEIDRLKNEKLDLEHKKDTILENSVQEITDRDANIAILQAEKEEMEIRLNELRNVVHENEDMKKEKTNWRREAEELQRLVISYSEVEQENKEFKEMIKTQCQQVYDSDNMLREKDAMLEQMQEQVINLERKIFQIESVQDKELQAQKERMNLQATAAATEKSRYLRELQELKDQLFRANASSDRDNALKDKVFNDAKGEVISLNKKLDKKTRKIKSLEESLQQIEGQMFGLDSEKKQLDDQVQHLKSLANENSVKAREEKRNMTSKSIRSDELVTELYCENAELMKQVANAETNQAKTEKQVRQLTDQKRALQRVISKLCNTYGITNLS